MLLWIVYKVLFSKLVLSRLIDSFKKEHELWPDKKQIIRRMHFSRMRTTRLLPVSPGIHCSRGVPGPGEGCTWFQGVYLVPVGCTWSQGVYLVPGGVPGLGGCTGLGGVCTWSWGVYLVLGCVPAQVLPPCGQNHRCLWKYNLAPTSLQAVIHACYFVCKFST